MKGKNILVIKKFESSLNLISENHSIVFVTGFDPLEDSHLEENVDSLPVLVLKKRGGWRAEPLEPLKEGNFGWFPSGNVLDLQIDGQNEVMICDRQETPEENNLYSS